MLRALVLVGLWLGAADAVAASLEPEKSPLVLGQVESVTLTLTVDEPAGEGDRPLRLSVNVGSFGTPQRVGVGRYKVPYTLPTTRFPQVALIALWRETGPEAPIHFFRLPLYGKTTLPVTTRPGAVVSVKVGETLFGPQSADARGKADIAIHVPPGVNKAQVTVRAANAEPRTQLAPIDLPPYNRLTAALVPHAIVPDGSGWARVEVLYDASVPVPANRIRLKASVGQLVPQSSDQGRFVFQYEPPVGDGHKQVEFTVTVDGDRHASAKAQLTLGTPPPSLLVIRPPPQPLPADGTTEATVLVTVTDAMGLGVEGQRVELFANGARVPMLKELGKGVYEYVYVLPRQYPAGGAVAFAATLAAPTPLRAEAQYRLQPPPPPADFTAQFLPGRVPADGVTESVLVVELKDAAGAPLNGAMVSATASHGTLGLLRPVGDGRYRAVYVGPKAIPAEPAQLRLVDAGGTFERTVPIPHRVNPYRLMAGLRGTVGHSLGRNGVFQGGVELFAPVVLGGSYFGIGLTASLGNASGEVRDFTGTVTHRSPVTLVPWSLRLGYELFATQRLSLMAGGGMLVTRADFHARPDQTPGTYWGGGAVGFAQASYALFRGHAFAEVSLGYSPLFTNEVSLEAGGVAFSLGYRVGLF